MHVHALQGLFYLTYTRNIIIKLFLNVVYEQLLQV